VIVDWPTTGRPAVNWTWSPTATFNSNFQVVSVFFLNVSVLVTEKSGSPTFPADDV
jgi:hypothetical protein